MKTLAFVVWTVVSPLDHVGMELVTEDPQDCAVYIDQMLPIIEQAGWEVMARCEYTSAPVSTVRPAPRP